MIPLSLPHPVGEPGERGEEVLDWPQLDPQRPRGRRDALEMATPARDEVRRGERLHRPRRQRSPVQTDHGDPDPVEIRLSGVRTVIEPR